jgi:hypothetical protein
MYNFNYDGSKFKLRIYRERYFINEKKRTVTVKAKVKFCVPDFITRTVSMDQLPDGFYPEWAHSNFEMTATARCAPEDEFDVDKGKKIAMAKLEATAYERFVGALVNWEARLKEFTRSVTLMTRDFAVKGTMAANHNWRYIDDITGTEEEVYDDCPEW